MGEYGFKVTSIKDIVVSNAETGEEIMRIENLNEVNMSNKK